LWSALRRLMTVTTAAASRPAKTAPTTTMAEPEPASAVGALVAPPMAVPGAPPDSVGGALEGTLCAAVGNDVGADWLGVGGGTFVLGAAVLGARVVGLAEGWLVLGRPVG
jgi:hypothetical protein